MYVSSSSIKIQKGFLLFTISDWNMNDFGTIFQLILFGVAIFGLFNVFSSIEEKIDIAEQNELEIVPNEYVKWSFICSYLSH